MIYICHANKAIEIIYNVIDSSKSNQLSVLFTRRNVRNDNNSITGISSSVSSGISNPLKYVKLTFIETWDCVSLSEYLSNLFIFRVWKNIV